MKYFIKIVAACFMLIICFSNTKAQQKCNVDVVGKWRVKKWYFFENMNETKDEHAERMKMYKKCLDGQITIDSMGIRVPNNICELWSCNNNFLAVYKTEIKKIVPDNSYTLYENGSEMIDSNIVGKKFVRLLDKNYSGKYLLLLDTECKQSYGDVTMKICIANKNRIGFFLGEELIILDRITSHMNSMQQ